METEFLDYDLEVVVLADISVSFELEHEFDEPEVRAIYQAWFENWQHRSGVREPASGL